MADIDPTDGVLTDAEWAAAVAEARADGVRAGEAGGSWVADGNTSERALREWVRMFDEGDPALEGPGSPLSGEWADGPSVESVAESAGVDPETCTPEELDELASAFEEGYAEGWWAEAERTVRALLGPGI